MDPLQTYINMVDAVLEEDGESARGAAESLLEWFVKGGGFAGASKGQQLKMIDQATIIAMATING